MGAIDSAIVMLEDEKKILEREMADLQQKCDAVSRALDALRVTPETVKQKTGRKPYTAEEREAQSLRMKERWARAHAAETAMSESKIAMAPLSNGEVPQSWM